MFIIILLPHAGWKHMFKIEKRRDRCLKNLFIDILVSFET